jgi:hypothetical protein
MVWLFFFFYFTLKSVLSFGCVYELESVSHPMMMRMVRLGLAGLRCRLLCPLFCGELSGFVRLPGYNME